MKNRIAYRNVADAPTAKGNVIEGYAVFWDVTSERLPWNETFAKRSFTDALKTSDPLLKVEHESSPLARMSAGNFDVTEDEVGLRYRAELDVENDYLAKALYSRVERGVIAGASVGILIPGTEVTTERSESGTEHDIITKVSKLVEISLVGVPVHDSTAATRAKSPEAEKIDETQADRARALRLQVRISRARAEKGLVR